VTDTHTHLVAVDECLVNGKKPYLKWLINNPSIMQKTLMHKRAHNWKAYRFKEWADNPYDAPPDEDDDDDIGAPLVDDDEGNERELR
jgi:hypothetical protein